MYSVKLEASLTYEFVLSYLAYTEKKNHAALEMGQDWIRSLNEELPKGFSTKVAAARRLCSGFPSVMMARAPAQTPSAFIEWLQGLSWSEV